MDRFVIFKAEQTAKLLRYRSMTRAAMQVRTVTSVNQHPFAAQFAQRAVSILTRANVQQMDTRSRSGTFFRHVSYPVIDK